MTQGEVVFYLREIHGHWTTSTVSSEKLGELAEAKLIEMQDGAASIVRLTAAGQQCKVAGRSRYNTTLSLTRSPDARPRTFRKRTATTKPRPLV
jgi:hypothetical protein